VSILKVVIDVGLVCLRFLVQRRGPRGWQGGHLWKALAQRCHAGL